MTEAVFSWGWRGMILVGVLSAVLLWFVPAPYGRHRRAGNRFAIPARLGWFLMELVSPVCFLLFFLPGASRPVLPALWLLHYVYRACIYPLLKPAGSRPMPVVILFSAVVFNFANGALNGWAAGSDYFPTPAPIFVVTGISLFLLGGSIHIRADSILRRLRSPGDTGYKMPRGGLYRWVSCPNYFGEILQWTGYALVASNPAAWAFAFFTLANLAPRARSHHRWYQREFSDYPSRRKALFPFVF